MIKNAYCAGDRDVFYKRLEYSSLWTDTDVVSIQTLNDSMGPSLTVDSVGNVYIAYFDETDYGTGSDFDIYFRRLSGPPPAPELAYIVPNPTESNFVSLDWNKVIGFKTNYYVYRSTSYIYSEEGLEPIAHIISSWYLDELLSEGFYYYAIVAKNFVGNSSISNCQYIEYKVPHLSEFLVVTSLIITTSLIFFVIVRFRKKSTKLN
ncbi:MAG: hypothetical protein ACTSUP_02950 [Candidatus Heimdallarchaeaceae archaeon]